MKTLAGIPIQEVSTKLGELLHPNAYKAVGGGGADLTDINPAYLTKVANEVFGLCGYGWKISFDPNDMQVTSETKTNSKGKEYVDYTATLNLLTLVYALQMDNGDIIWSESIPANGSNSNTDIGYAMRGALTNAIGAAFAKLGWQLPVYMGVVNHHNAASLWEKKYGNGKPQNGGEKKPAAEQTKKEEKAAPAPEPVVDDALEVALKVVIPDDGKIPLHSITLGEAIKDQQFGIAIIKYLTGEHPNQAGDKFNGDEAVKAAAKIVFNNLTQVAKKNGK